MIAIEQYRAAIGKFNNVLSSKKIKCFNSFIDLMKTCLVINNVSLFNLFFICLSLKIESVPRIVIAILLLRSGLHPNPGPSCGGLKICHVNVQSLYMRSHVSDPLEKLDDLSIVLCQDYKMDIICLSETWLTQDINNDKIILDGYSLIRRDSGGMRGGVAIYYNDDMLCSELTDINPTRSEVLWVRLRNKTDKVFLGVCYRPPNQSVTDIDNFLDELQVSFDAAKSMNPDSIVLLGDFNDPCTNWDSSHNKSELKLKLFNWAQRNSLRQLINEPTFYTPHSSNILDLIFTDTPGRIMESGVLPPLNRVGKYTHCPITCTLNLQCARDRAYSRRIWKYDLGDFIHLNQAFTQMNWVNIVRSSSSVSEATDIITDVIQKSSSTYIPNKCVIIRPRDKPWMTSHIRLLLRQRDRAFKKCKFTKSDYYKK